tara:strand:- start:3101 stop:3343 length:243 start_codon:yes stop_codon:yes gene_type:complete
MIIDINNIDDKSKIKLLKMMFLYNALKDGWCIKEINRNKYEFTKSDRDIVKDFHSEDFLDIFIGKNTQNIDIFDDLELDI